MSLTNLSLPAILIKRSSGTGPVAVFVVPLFIFTSPTSRFNYKDLRHQCGSHCHSDGHNMVCSQCLQYELKTQATGCELGYHHKRHLRGLLAIDGKGRCVDVNCKRRRRILAKLRGQTAALRIETGRWSGFKREERLCRQCRLEEVEDVEHFLLRCEGWAQEREW